MCGIKEESETIPVENLLFAFQLDCLQSRQVLHIRDTRQIGEGWQLK